MIEKSGRKRKRKRKNPFHDECGRGLWDSCPVRPFLGPVPARSNFLSLIFPPVVLTGPRKVECGTVSLAGSVVKASSGLFPQPFLMTVNLFKELLTIVNVHGKRIRVKAERIFSFLPEK
jgi:hypothetical protein